MVLRLPQATSLDMRSQRITNLATPTAGTDAVTMEYVDSDIPDIHPLDDTITYETGDLIVRESSTTGNIIWRALGTVNPGEVTDASFPNLVTDSSTARFQQLGPTSAGSLTAGNGIAISSGTISVDIATGDGLVFNNGDLQVNHNSVITRYNSNRLSQYVAGDIVYLITGAGPGQQIHYFTAATTMPTAGPSVTMPNTQWIEITPEAGGTDSRNLFVRYATTLTSTLSTDVFSRVLNASSGDGLDGSGTLSLRGTWRPVRYTGTSTDPFTILDAANIVTDWSQVTHIGIDPDDSDSATISESDLRRGVSGDVLYIRESATSWAVFRLTGGPIGTESDVPFPVTRIASAGVSGGDGTVTDIWTNIDASNVQATAANLERANGGTTIEIPSSTGITTTQSDDTRFVGYALSETAPTTVDQILWFELSEAGGTTITAGLTLPANPTVGQLFILEAGISGATDDTQHRGLFRFQGESFSPITQANSGGMYDIGTGSLSMTWQGATAPAVITDRDYRITFTVATVVYTVTLPSQDITASGNSWTIRNVRPMGLAADGSASAIAVQVGSANEWELVAAHDWTALTSRPFDNVDFSENNAPNYSTNNSDFGVMKTDVRNGQRFLDVDLDAIPLEGLGNVFGVFGTRPTSGPKQITYNRDDNNEFGGIWNISDAPVNDGVTREQATAIADQESLRIVRETAIRPDRETTDTVRNTQQIAVNNDTQSGLSFNIEGFNDVAAGIRVLSFATQQDAVNFYNFVNIDAVNPNITTADWDVSTNTFPPHITQNRSWEFFFTRHSDDVPPGEGISPPGDIVSAGLNTDSNLRRFDIGRPTDSGAAYSTTNYFVTWHDSFGDDLTLGNTLHAGSSTVSSGVFDFNNIANVQLSGNNLRVEIFIHTERSSPNGDINHYVNVGASIERTPAAMAAAVATALENDHFVVGRFEVERIGNDVSITTLDQRLYPISNIQLRWDHEGSNERVLTYSSRPITFPNSVTPAQLFPENQHRHLYNEPTSNGITYYDGIYVPAQRRIGFTVDEANGFTQTTWQRGDILNITENPTITDGRITGSNTDNLAHIRTVSRLGAITGRGSSIGYGANGNAGFIVTAEMEDAAANYSIGPVNDLTGVRELTGTHFWLPSVSNVPSSTRGNVIFRAFVPPITGEPTSINNTFDIGDNTTEDYYIYYPLTERDMIDNDIVPAIPALERNASRDGTSISVDSLIIGRLAQMDTPANRAIITDTSRWTIRSRTVGGTVGYYLVFRAGTSGIVLNSPNLGDTNIEFNLSVHVPEFYYFVRQPNANDARTANTALRAGRSFFTTAREVEANNDEFGFRLPDNTVIPNRDVGLLRGWINEDTTTESFNTNGNGLYLKTSTSEFRYEQRARIAATYTPFITQSRNGVTTSNNPDNAAFVNHGGVGASNGYAYTGGTRTAAQQQADGTFVVGFRGNDITGSTTDGDPQRFDAAQLATLLGVDQGYNTNGLTLSGSNVQAVIQFSNPVGSATFNDEDDEGFLIVGLGSRNDGFRNGMGLVELRQLGTSPSTPTASGTTDATRLSGSSWFRLRTNNPQTQLSQTLNGAGFFSFDGATNSFTPLPLSTPSVT